MKPVEQLFSDKLQELKNAPHKQFINNEIAAVEKTDFIDEKVLNKTAISFFAFLKEREQRKHIQILEGTFG